MMVSSVWHFAQMLGEVSRKVGSPVGPVMVWTPWQSVHEGTSGFFSTNTPAPCTLEAYSSKMPLWHRAQVLAILACSEGASVPSAFFRNGVSRCGLWQSMQVGAFKLPASNSLVWALSFNWSE